MEYPIGSIVKVKKNAEIITAGVVAFYPGRNDKYALLPVFFDSKSNKYRAKEGEQIYGSNGDGITGLDNVWPLSYVQVKSLVNMTGADGERFIAKMIEENKANVVAKQ